jgi:hypothetical protein
MKAGRRGQNHVYALLGHFQAKKQYTRGKNKLGLLLGPVVRDLRVFFVWSSLTLIPPSSLPKAIIERIMSCSRSSRQSAEALSPFHRPVKGRRETDFVGLFLVFSGAPWLPTFVPA